MPALLELITFSGCEHLRTEKGSCDIYAIIFIPLVLVTVLFPWHFQVLFPFSEWSGTSCLELGF